MKRKVYEPVREFERQTSYCPLYLAWRIVDEARQYFRTEIPESYARKLARRAEAVFAHHPWWRKDAVSARGYGHILSFMRHWLAGVLARERPALFRALPESFKIGKPLPSSDLRPPSPIRWAKDTPEKPRSSGRQSAPSSHSESQSRFTSAATISRAGSRGRSPHHCFVHGCELMAV